MREKETAADYRYFPNPELMPIMIDQDWIDRIRASLPEMPSEKFDRMTRLLGLPETECRLITGSRNLSQIFDDTLCHIDKPKDVVNWIIGELLSISKASGVSDDSIVVDCGKFAKVIELVDERIINRATGKKILIKVIEDGCDPETYIRENGLGIVADASLLENAIRDVMAENEKAVAEYRAGTQKAFGFLVGQVMRKSAGKADPHSVNELLVKMLGE
jgi:aspartyl-tRNA(Asn)/glutamyl-tRNA(Gln) amidotransferase subunit B